MINSVDTSPILENAWLAGFIDAYSPAKHSIIIAYLEKFPLFSSKRLNYCDWKLCYNMMINKQHLTSEGRSKIKTIKAGMKVNFTLVKGADGAWMVDTLKPAATQ